ncbi:hypothetical protein EVAR_21721_1 [Eumeta japonica]|uniref:Uncharacterized protein n=1 Tax=Eumeta variegata TaxID=151549 RepID=A0A4C1W8U4_EUMVA|nr:hypothetical protein EVAR_21721_1 [Eumeta japonica]
MVTTASRISRSARDGSSYEKNDPRADIGGIWGRALHVSTVTSGIFRIEGGGVRGVGADTAVAYDIGLWPDVEGRGVGGQFFSSMAANVGVLSEVKPLLHVAKDGVDAPLHHTGQGCSTTGSEVSYGSMSRTPPVATFSLDTFFSSLRGGRGLPGFGTLLLLLGSSSTAYVRSKGPGSQNLYLIGSSIVGTAIILSDVDSRPYRNGCCYLAPVKTDISGRRPYRHKGR